MRTANLSHVIVSIAALGLWACSGGGTGGTTTGGTTTGGSGTSGGTSSGGTSGGGDAGLQGLNDPCTIGASPDPCPANGLACTQTADLSTTCQLPGELSPCLTVPGCADTIPPLHCESGFMNAGVKVNICVNYCTVTADCPDSKTICQNATHKICFYSGCGPGSMPANGTAYYGPCNSGGTGNGTCIPYNPSPDPGICVGNGPVALWQPCSDQRPDGGTSDLCVSGSTCAMFPVANLPPKTLCAPLCAPTGATISGPPCGTGDICISAGAVDFGYCLTDCSGGQNCPSPTGCGGLSVGSGTLHVCLP